MKQRFILFRRAGVFYYEDSSIGQGSTAIWIVKSHVPDVTFTICGIAPFKNLLWRLFGWQAAVQPKRLADRGISIPTPGFPAGLSVCRE